MALPGLDPDLLYAHLRSLDPIERLVQATKAIELARDQLLPDLATLRRTATYEARATMRPAVIARESGHSPQTIGRLLAEAASSYHDDHE